MTSLMQAVARIQQFSKGSLAAPIGDLERRLLTKTRQDVPTILSQANVNPDLLASALVLKQAARQVNELVHATAIALALPHILADGEMIEETSLAADASGKQFDLVTDRRIAEFKFNVWQGKGERPRQKMLFKDFYNLSESDSGKKKYLYVINADIPLRFLRGKSKIDNVLKDSALLAVFRSRYPTTFNQVGQYYECMKDRVVIMDIGLILPALLQLGIDEDIDADAE